MDEAGANFLSPEARRGRLPLDIIDNEKNNDIHYIYVIYIYIYIYRYSEKE